MTSRGVKKAMARPEIDQLQEQMHQVRRNLGEDVHGLIENTRAMTDWRSLWRKHPWVGAAAAATLGYLVVPARRFGKADARRLADLASATATSVPLSPARRIAWEIAGIILGAVAQRGIQFLGQSVLRRVADRPDSRYAPEPESEEASHDHE